MRRCELAAQQAWVLLYNVLCPLTAFKTLPLLFATLLHPLLPLLLRDDWGTVVGVGLGESCSHDGRALGADCRADGHEEAMEMSAWCAQVA